MTGLFFFAAFLSLAVMFWPYMIPYSVTVASAAAPDASLQFLFYGGILVLPVIAAYTAGVYWSSAARFARRATERFLNQYIYFPCKQLMAMRHQPGGRIVGPMSAGEGSPGAHQLCRHKKQQQRDRGFR